MIIPNPQDKKWIQNNNSDVTGNLYSSFGLDLLSNQGKVRSSSQMFLNVNNSDTNCTNLGIPVAFKSFTVSGQVFIYAVAGSRVFKTAVSYPSGPFAEDVSSGAPTTCGSDFSDMDIFNGTLYVTTASKVIKKLSSAGTWGTLDTLFADNNSPKMLCPFGNRMYMSTDNATGIISWDASETVSPASGSPGSAANSILLNNADSSTLTITFIRASSNRIWIGTMNSSGGKGYVYEWDGAAAQVTKSYRLDCSGALSCVIKDDIPYIMNTNGIIQVWNGGTFKDLDDARIGQPAELNRIYNYLLYKPLNTLNDRFIHPNGMSLINGEINIMVNTVNFNSSANTEVTMPAGIWEYLPEVGLYHKNAVTYVRSTDTFPYTDGGQLKIAAAGALSEMNLMSNSVSRNGILLCGAKYYTDASATAFGIWYDDTFRSATSPGYFVTTKISSSNVTDIWQKLFIAFRQFTTSTEKILVKYRFIDADPTEVTITWTGISSFTSSADLSGYAIGDEVQVIQGVGSAFCAHITAISLNAGTYTVTVDETFTGATGTAIAWISKWTKLASITGTTTNFKECPIGEGVNTWIQFKIWFNFRIFDEIEQLLIANVPNQKIQ